MLFDLFFSILNIFHFNILGCLLKRLFLSTLFTRVRVGGLGFINFSTGSSLLVMLLDHFFVKLDVFV